MTRWARAGSAQKHKKLPGDATKWGEFDLQRCSSSNQKVQKERKQDIKGKEESLTAVDISARKFSGSNKLKKRNLPDKKNINDDESENFHEQASSCNEQASSCISNIIPSNTNEELNSQDKHFVKNTSLKKLKNKKKIDEQNVEHDKNSKVSGMKASAKKKGMYLEKLKKKRAENGILLLPSKTERKLYNIKRKLREKRLPPALIKDIIRKERRKEELKFRKTVNPSKLCFNCRQAGHILADCPVKLGSSNQETGICCKCGSADHTSFKCPEEVQGFPFAKCFICKEQGHISRDCPRNKHGVYPKGGRCNLCGNVNHLKKDCPSLIKRNNDESSITLETIGEGTSMDAEVPEVSLKKEKIKRPKIVKF